MSKQRVLLVCSQHLFGESMETILRAEAGVELIGPWDLGVEVCPRITEASPDVVLIVDEDSQSEASVNLTSAIMEMYPELPIIRVDLTENIFHVFSAHTFPARSADLIEAIMNLPGESPWGRSKDNSYPKP
jgi:chemotaxis response regulator CheB